MRKKGYRSVSIVVHITTVEERRIQLPNPVPILSGLEITSTPPNAVVMMDGKELGTTPILLPNLLVGEHELTFSKKNYQTVTKLVEIKENEVGKLHVELSGECRVEVNSSPFGAEVTIDGKYFGITPLNCNLYAGTYTIGISKQGYNPIEELMTVDGSKEVFDFVLKRRYVYPKATYLDVGVSVVNVLSVYGALGFFANNFNVELGYAYGLQSSQPIYWNGESGFYERYYTPHFIMGKLGYGIICGNRVRITPQIGCDFLTLHESCHDGNSEKILKGASMISGVLSVRCDMMIGKHLGVCIAPQYLLSLWNSPWTTTLKALSPTIEGWSDGFSLQTGISLYF